MTKIEALTDLHQQAREEGRRAGYAAAVEDVKKLLSLIAQKEVD